MKTTKIVYWVFTILLVIILGFSSIPDILYQPEAMKFITDLGYPFYIPVFLGIAKLLGAFALLIPGFPRVKEWAYAGITFDFIGATYSMYKINGFKVGELFMLICFFLLTMSYVYYHKTLNKLN